MKFIAKVALVTGTAAGTVLSFALPANAVESTSVSRTTDAHITSWPAPGTGGLILRDKHGNDLGSGIGEGQDFEFTMCGEKGSGLVKIRQLTRGTGGGWGNLYEGYVKIRWTSAPVMFTMCD